MNEIKLLAESSQLDDTTTLSLQSNFEPFLIQAKEWEEKAKSIVVINENQKQEMVLAKEMRLEIKSFRVNVEKVRKELKEESLRKWQAIDKVANIIKSIVEPIEEYLETQEKFIIIQEQKRKAELKAQRLQILSKYEVSQERIAIIKLDELSDEEFETFRLESQQLQEYKIKEKERLENEAKENEAERIRLQEENRILMEEKRIKDAELAKANAEIEKANKEREDQIAREAMELKKEQEKIENEEKEKKKLQQDMEYQNFLSSNWYSEANKSDYHIIKDSNWITLFKKVAVFNILPF